MEITPSQTAVYKLVTQYVTRQELVLAAITELRPDILSLAKGETNEELLQMVKQYANVPQVGRWGPDKEWSYFIHGGGCRLIHTLTQEPIEWDAPNVRECDRFWFMNYLIWWLTQASSMDNEPESLLKKWFDNNDEMLKRMVFETIDQLQKMGLLLQHNPLNLNRFVVPA